MSNQERPDLLGKMANIRWEKAYASEVNYRGILSSEEKEQLIQELAVTRGILETVLSATGLNQESPELKDAVWYSQLTGAIGVYEAITGDNTSYLKSNK